MVALAAAVLAAMFLGGGWWWLARTRALEREAATREIEEVLERAKSFAQHAGWKEALIEGKRAEALLEKAGNERLKSQVEELLMDLTMVRSLDAIRLGASEIHDGHFDLARSDREYKQAFRAYGINVGKLVPEKGAAQLRERPIRAQLVAALDDWVLASRSTARRKQLIHLARLLDPDPWRDRLRQYLLGRDWRGLKKLAGMGRAIEGSPSLLALLATELSSVGDHPGAVRVLRHGQRMYPDDFWVNYRLGFHLLNLKPPRMEEAVRFFGAALAVRPHNPGVYLTLGYTLEQKGDLDGALAAYRNAIMFKPDFAQAFNNLGHALLKKGNSDGAIAAFRGAIRLQPDFPLALNNLGRALMAKGRPEAAIAAFRRAIRLKPSFGEANKNYGIALAHIGKLDDAIGEFRRAIRLQPADAEAHFNLGMALEKQGKLDGAIAAYRRAMDIDPNFAQKMVEHFLDMSRFFHQ
jgi:tetratricopeptide (TPR) repeat protein